MRAVLLVFLFLLVPIAQAGLGPYGDDGWPINIDGESTDPHGHDQNRIGPVTVFPYYPILTAEVQRLAEAHPDLVRLSSAGQSTLGLELWILEIANFADPDMLPLDEREVVWVDGGTHSNEYSGVYFALAVAQYLLEGYGTDELATFIVDNRHTWVLPMVNPDGSNVMGRLNANLVNINRNYPVVWDGEGHDAVMNNRGPSPASEVETRIQIEWMNRTQPDYYASVHCCGVLWLFPYGEEGVDPPQNDYTVYEAICNGAFPDVRQRCGPIWSTIYPASGSSVDTAYEYTGAISFGYEMSGRGTVAAGNIPLTVENVATQEYESWDGLMKAFEEVHLYGAYPVLLDVEPAGMTTRLTIGNAGFGNLTTFAIAAAHEGDTAAQWYGLDFSGAVVEPGASFVMHVPIEVTDGTELTFQYVKRDMGRPEGIRTVTVDLSADLPDSMAPVDGTFNAANIPRDGEGRDTPFPAMSLVALVLLASAMRRRH